LRNTIALLILGSLALGLLVAGCGGGGSDSAGAQEIDKATFVKRADAICEQASGKLSAEALALTQSESAKPNYEREKLQVHLVNRILIPGLDAELEELRALGMPSEGKQEVQAFFKAVQGVANTAEADPGAFAEGVGGYESAELAGRKYGITACPISAVNPPS
jgi:hypothetical protein